MPDHPARPIPSVGYWRMSSRDQEKSIGQQRAEMLPRCRLAGLELVQEFQDEGISGGGMKKRDAFLEMLAFCKKRHKDGKPIEAIVCWDTSRFSRATSIESAHYIWEFQQAGVHRVFTWERWFDFNREEDRAIFLLMQDFTNNRFLRNLSENILRGKKEVAAAGYFTGGMVPYGFDRLLVSDQGEVVERIRRGDKIALRRKDFHIVLAPIADDDPDPDRQTERQTVIWLYEQMDTRHVSQRQLAKELNEKGIPGPGSHYHRRLQGPGVFLWTVAAVKGILTNPVHAGVQEVGSVGRGEYHRLDGAEIRAVAPGAVRTYQAAPGKTIRCQLEHGGLVSPELWERVQRKLQERTAGRTFPRSSGYPIPGGILHCGHCGGRMYGATCRPKRGEKVYEYRSYRCASNVSKPGTCGNYSVPEGIILDKLLDRLLNVYLAPDRLAGLERQLLDKTEAKHTKAPEAIRRLRKQVEALDGEVRQAAQNVLRCKDNVDLLNDHLTTVRRKREKLARQLAETEQVATTPTTQAAAVVRATIGKLATLRQRLQDAVAANRDTKVTAKLAEVFRLLVSRVDVYFRPVERGKRTWHEFARGVVKFRPVLGVSESDEHLR
jgi:DNA invertase Pin-like site-specific DNA recombinase